MIIKEIAQTPAAPVEAEGAQNVRVRVLLGPQDQAPTFALRLFELGPGGCTPWHSHPFEHEIIIEQGELTAVTEQGEQPLRVGQVVLVQPDEKHQFRNRSVTQPARMFCLVPVQYQK